MPLITLRCDPCDREWQTITGKTVAWEETDGECVACGLPGVRQIDRGGSYHRVEDMDDVMRKDPLEVQMILKNKAILESRSAEILDGRLGIVETGPKELRPKCPEGLLKKYY